MDKFLRHLIDYELNLIEIQSADQSNIEQVYLDPETYLTENYNQVLEHYENELQTTN